MEELQEALKDLRGVHEPTSLGFWPPAPGWWLILCLIILLFLLWRWLKGRKTPNYKKMANEELTNILANYEIQGNSHQATVEIALLIRKLILASETSMPVANLTGDEWLAYLDKKSQSQLFSEGAGRALKTVVYQKTSNVKISDLLDATKVLIKNV